MAAKATKSPPASPADKDIASLQVTLPQMLDLALGTPEVGAVNLNILHNFLHILLHQINLKSTKVEYRGDDAKRIKTMVSSLKAGPSLYLQEYSIIDESNQEKHVRSAAAVDVQVDIIIEETDEATKMTKGTKQQIGPGTTGEQETVIFVEPIVDGATPTALGFKRIEQTVNELQQRFQALEELSSTPELIERIKGKITDPVTDVWQIINITKRLDASEQGIDKLTKMVQDVIKGDATIGTEAPSGLDERLVNLENALNNLEDTVQNLQVIANTEDAKDENVAAGEKTDAKENELPSAGPRISLSQLLGGIDVKEMHQNVATLQGDVKQMKQTLKNMEEKIKDAVTETAQKTEAKQDTGQKEEKEQKPKEASKDAETTQVEEKKEAAETAEKRIQKQPDEHEIKEMHKEKRPESPQSPTKDMITEPPMSTDELHILKERVSKLEKDVSCLNEKVDSAPMAGVAGSADIDDLMSKVQEIQGEMEKLNQTADRLIDDRENREMHLNALLEQVEILKTIKADREDLEDALADKADAQAIHRKVSYDQFDAACDDLAQGLEEAINKLGKQETIWQQAMDDVQKEIEGKVDKMEMSPLKDFVNHRLKSLQERLKKVAETRQESEAAGTKKLLRDVQCISCDKDVVMRMDGGHKHKVEALPCTASMKPYLTYELDQVRKQHRRLPHSRNMIQFEAAMQEEARKQKSARADTLVKTPRDHLCNRYCGGSHTITTPQQRVMRMGHFITEWGPEIIQLTEGMIKGTDGRMYRSRRVPDKIDVCGPAYCEDRGDDVRPSPERPSYGTISLKKLSDKQVSVSPKKRSSRRHSRDISKEAMEGLAEVSGTDDQETVDTPRDRGEPPGHTVRYIEDEEMGEDD
ncbi:Glutamine-rich protein 2 [Anthophora plagiata]